ncbi:hypothetical protein BO94DRAFT_621095 [Aspergillus sclerotioniger CBS 115572]|uniref:Uncharacterized protein n=1 Tax=Aspergillus sclerotioniger CBS 115572 TaxID=1450535 RepID=A0A317X8W6_9EURO|nr:hypothetical protein BO94DRAFT_621095 [Aspergillus sclerotioniger CBS 115572]PWY94631.1 hypothetical protein BO94DRAFT_621095 [Aspergillus sclerotioniger CBS 115572]
MLFRLALCISTAAAAALPAAQQQVTANSHQINLPAVPCAFSDSSCSEALDPISHLTIDFSTQNGSLLANKQSIFPASVPMQFTADRKWDNSIQPVQVTFSLDVRPLPIRPGAGLGEVYYMKLRLFDQHGRPATQNTVAISLLSDAHGNLQLAMIDPNGSREYGHGNRVWQMKAWKAQLETYYHSAKEAVKSCIKPGHSIAEEHEHHYEHEHKQPSHTSDSHDHRHPSTKYPPVFKNGQSGGFFWAGSEQSIMKIARPVILPALMGILAGGVACVIGFLLGRLVISIYLCAASRREQRIPIIHIEDGEIFSEKDALLEHYSDQEPDARQSCQ